MSNAGRVRSLNHMNELGTEVRLLLEEKEQNLLASQETVQVGVETSQMLSLQCLTLFLCTFK